MDSRSIFIELIESYLSGDSNAEDTVLKLYGKVGNELNSKKDNLLIHCYLAIKYLVDECKTTEKELKYLLVCLRGQKEFSKEGLIDAIFDKRGKVFYVPFGIHKSSR